MTARAHTVLSCDHRGTDGTCDARIELDLSPDRARSLAREHGWGPLAAFTDLCPRHSGRRPPYRGHYRHD